MYHIFSFNGIAYQIIAEDIFRAVYYTKYINTRLADSFYLYSRDTSYDKSFTTFDADFEISLLAHMFTKSASSTF